MFIKTLQLPYFSVLFFEIHKLIFLTPWFPLEPPLWSSQWIVFISHGNNSCRRSQPLFRHSSAWRQYEAIRCMWAISELSFFLSHSVLWLDGSQSSHYLIWLHLCDRSYCVISLHHFIVYIKLLKKTFISKQIPSIMLDSLQDILIFTINLWPDYWM